MLRASVGSVAVVVLVVGGWAVAADESGKKHDKGQPAKITKVDPEHGTITVRMKDKGGKEVNRTFHFTGELQMFDDNGKTIRVADVGIFRSGDDVLLVEREGKIREMRKKPNAKKSDKKSEQNKPAGK